jgi:branched-chain amino acid transport system ATP-binding protein
MLKVQNIDMSYGDLQVLWDVSFEIREGEILVLVGANGAGKSSIIKTISGLQKVSRGKITFMDEDITNEKPETILKKGIVHVPEGRRLFNEMTVEENLILGALWGEAKQKRKETMEMCYDLFPKLRERRQQLAGTLSGGEQQMVAIARGLMSLPKLLMLDEPSLGLAPVLVQDVFEIVKSVNRQGITVLLVEQNVQSTLKFCDRAYVLENGKIVLEGTGQELLNNEHVKEAFLGI